MSLDTGSLLLEDLYKSLEAKYNKPREGVHVSDIALCPRETVFRRLEPQGIDNTQLGFFTSGEAIGIAIQALATSDPERYKAEYEIKFEGLEAHIDLYDSINNIPIECKSFNGADMEAPKPHYIAQLKAYMAMLGAKKGIILVQILQHFRSKAGNKNGPFKTWIVTMDDEQILQERIRLMKERTDFQVSLMLKDPSKARHVVGNTDLSWKCNYCKYVAKCQAINKAVKK